MLQRGVETILDKGVLGFQSSPVLAEDLPSFVK